MKIELYGERLKKEFVTTLDPRLQFVLHAIADKFEGVRVTCIGRTLEENTQVGGVWKSKHLVNHEGVVLAVDLNPPWSSKMPDAWRLQVKAYLDANTEGIQTIIHKGTALHVHMELEPRPGSEVELTA